MCLEGKFNFMDKTDNFGTDLHVKQLSKIQI